MKAKFKWQAVIVDGKKMWKLVGWEGVEKEEVVEREIDFRKGPRFSLCYYSNVALYVAGDTRLHSFIPVHRRSIAGGEIVKGDTFTPEQRSILEEVFKKAGERLANARKAAREKKAVRSMFGMDIIERSCIATAKDTETEFTVTKGNRKAVLKWKKEGDNFRFNGVEGDIEIIPANWCVNLRHPVSGYDCGLALRIKTTAIDGVHLSTGGISSAYQRSMWNNMFFAAVSEYWRQLDENENDKKAKEDEAWLAQGEQTFEV
jgi:hypothetical protein